MRVCSLFCGIGGIDLAFEQAGHEIVWANDNDKFACMTYRHNFPNVNLFEADIRSVEKSQLPYALAELVANAYDADATNVTVMLYDSVPNDKRIIIEDNGDGMSYEEVKEISDLKETGLFSEKDCLDLLSLLSHLFKRLDESKKRS